MKLLNANITKDYFKVYFMHDVRLLKKLASSIC